MATTLVEDPTSSPLDPMARPDAGSQPVRGAYMALGVLLAINLFNYIDRQVLAGVEPEIRKSFFPADPNGTAAKALSGTLASAFLVSYMLTAPLFGALAQRFSRWKLIALGVFVWSAATGAGGLSAPVSLFSIQIGAFAMMFLTRCFVGVGEGAYGPLAPAILSDCFPVAKRGKILSLFYAAMPIGGALGYILGGNVAKWDQAHESWRWAFYIVVVPGLILGLLSLLMRDAKVGAADAVSAPRRMSWRDCRILFETPSFVLNTLGMTAMAFAMGALAYWMPAYLEDFPAADLWGIERRSVFGMITALAGLGGTLLGGVLGDWLRPRLSGSYFHVSACGLVLSGAFVVAFLFVPFPWAWLMIFAAVFFMFINTGPTNAILANVVHPVMRPAGFALNILVMHALGDVISPWTIGAISGRWKWPAAFEVVAAFLVLGGLLWLWGGRYLQRDTEIAPQRLQITTCSQTAQES